MTKAKTKTRRGSDVLDALPALEKIMGGPLTFGGMLEAIREGDELTLDAFARKIGISRANLCDIEQSRKAVSPERAVKWAKTLGYPEALFVKLALQDALNRADIKLEVEVHAPRKRKAA
jgi:transcriptional regulator with XRE-family HTH domain